MRWIGVLLRKSLLSDCERATPDVQLKEVGQVQVVLKVEAERVVQDVGHVEPAKEAKLYHDPRQGEVDDEGEAEGGIVLLVVAGMLQHEHAHHDPAHQSPPDHHSVEMGRLVLRQDLLVLQLPLEPHQGGDDVFVILGNHHLLLVSIGAKLVDQVDCPG